MQLPVVETEFPLHHFDSVNGNNSIFCFSPFLSIKLEDIALIRDCLMVLLRFASLSLFLYPISETCVAERRWRSAATLGPACLPTQKTTTTMTTTSSNNNLSGFKLTWLVLSCDEINDRN